ncbi:MAG: ABC transporter permease [Clostridia bacterium]|nr:ABC transporter permease [Clostridia bacterium]
MDKQFEKYNNIPQEKFEFAIENDFSHDKKFDTKPVSFFRDAMRRFAKNKGSVVGAIIILILVLFAIIGPFCCDQGFQDSYQTETLLKRYKELPPRLLFMEGTGFWDGTKKVEVSSGRFAILKGMAIETGYNPIDEIIDTTTTVDPFGIEKTKYSIRLNTYYSIDVFTLTLTEDEYEAMQRWQEENDLQVILPRVDTKKSPLYGYGQLSVWYLSDQKGKPILDKDGNYQHGYYTEQASLDNGFDATYSDGYTSTRLDIDPGKNDPNAVTRFHYAQRSGTADKGYNYVVRVNAYNYFIYKYGFEPSFIFGTNEKGYDIFTRLASGARFSLILATCVAIINLTIGAIIGAIEGYYGGIVDMTIERIIDVLGGIPGIVVQVLFQLHLAHRVGIVGALIFAFILTGWIGMAASVRVQFYRFKNREYVLAARTLGARDSRIIWKHIFPNSLGTLITSTALVIPGIIRSETQLSYLGIINLDSATMSSVGSMLSTGQAIMTTSPHVVLFPAIFIALLMLSFNLFGNGLRDAFNPQLRGEG